MQDTKLPKRLFCRCENGTPCFDTIHEIEQWHATELSTYKQKLIEWAEGKQYDFIEGNGYKTFTNSKGSAETMEQFVYNQALTDLINHIKGEK